MNAQAPGDANGGLALVSGMKICMYLTGQNCGVNNKFKVHVVHKCSCSHLNRYCNHL